MKFVYYSLLLMCAALSGCTKEDESPSNVDRNMFNMPDYSSEEEMALRQSFLEATSCYLIFNDSLYNREVTTPSGTTVEPVILNLSYEVTGTQEHAFRFTLLKDMAKKERAVTFLEDEVLPRINPIFYPYSFFLVDEFYMQEADSYGELSPEEARAAYTCYYTTLVACTGLDEMDETERYLHIRGIVEGIMVRRYTELDDSEYADFYQYSESLYGSYPDYDETVLEIGFLETFQGSWTMSFYERENDLLAYVQEIFALTEEEFDEKYADWPRVLEKKEALVKIFERNGVQVY